MMTTEVGGGRRTEDGRSHLGGYYQRARSLTGERGKLSPLPGGYGVFVDALVAPTLDFAQVVLVAGQILVALDGLEALQALSFDFVEGLSGDAPGVEAGANGSAYLVTGQAGAHGSQEEFVIVGWVYGGIALLKGRSLDLPPLGLSSLPDCSSSCWCEPKPRLRSVRCLILIFYNIIL
jgi:hypothetical protein